MSPLPHLAPTVVRSELAKRTYLRDRLKAEIPDLDPETLSDTLDGINDLKELLAHLIRSALEDEALAEGLKLRLSDMKARLERLEVRARKKRDLVLWAMTEGDIPKLLEPDFTASLRQGAATLDIVSEEAIPEDFWKPQPAKLDRSGLIAALKSGLKTNAARLSAPQLQLSVRTK